MNFANLTISPHALPWLAWCLAAPALAAHITTLPTAGRTTSLGPLLVLAAFFVAGVVAGLPTMTGRHAGSFAQLLALAVPSVAGAAAAYALAFLMPHGVNRIVHGVLAFLIALVCTAVTWLVIFLPALRRIGTAP